MPTGQKIVNLSYLWISILSLIPISPMLAQPTQKAPAIEIKEETVPGILLGKHLEIYRDATKKRSFKFIHKNFDRLNFTISNRDVPAMGYKVDADFWARFRIDNKTTTVKKLLLSSEYAPIDYVSLYDRTLGGDFQVRTYGDKLPYVKREIDHRHPTFRIEVPPGVSQFYVKLKTTSSVQFNLTLWDPESFRDYKLRENTLLGILLGIVIISILSNLFIYLCFKENAYLVYCGLIATFLIFESNYHGVLQQYIFNTQSDSWFVNDLINISVDLMSILSFSFTISLLGLRVRSPKLFKILYALRIFLIFNVINHLTFDLAAMKISIFFTVFNSFVFLIVGIKLGMTFRPALYFATAFLGVAFGTLCSIFTGIGLIPYSFLSTWGQFIGGCFEMVVFSLALGDKFALVSQEKREALENQWQAQEKLAKAEAENAAAKARLLEEREAHIQNLDQEVANKTSEIKSILKNIQEGILMLHASNHNILVSSEYSTYAFDFLKQDNLTGSDIFEILFSKSNLDEESLNVLKSTLDSAMDQEALCWEVNQHLLPKKIKWIDNDQEKQLSLDWSPLVNENTEIVEGALLAFKDVTAFKKLEKESQKHERQMQYLSLILKVDERRFGEYLEFFEQTLAGIFNLVENNLEEQKLFSESSKNAIRQIYRDLHTLKGISRSYEFKEISNNLHLAEGIIQDWLDAGSINNLREFEIGLEVLKSIFKDFVYINNELLHRETSHLNIERSVLVQKINELRSALSHRNIDRNKVNKILWNFSLVHSDNLENLFNSEMRGLSSICRRLGKPVPHTRFINDRFLIHEKAKPILKTVLSHSVRNAVDHGIERPKVREELGKDPRGRLTLEIENFDENLVEIKFFDDGRGLNLTKIKKRALELNLIHPHSSRTPENLAQLIFEAGFSTSEVVTEISGRGVGLDAIKTAIEEVGGRINVLLEESDLHPFYPFKMQILMPKAYFDEFPEDAILSDKAA